MHWIVAVPSTAVAVYNCWNCHHRHDGTSEFPGIRPGQAPPVRSSGAVRVPRVCRCLFSWHSDQTRIRRASGPVWPHVSRLISRHSSDSGPRRHGVARVDSALPSVCARFFEMRSKFSLSLIERLAIGASQNAAHDLRNPSRSLRTRRKDTLQQGFSALTCSFKKLWSGRLRVSARQLQLACGNSLQ